VAGDEQPDQTTGGHFITTRIARVRPHPPACCASFSTITAAHQRHHLRGEALHLLELRAALQQQQVDADRREPADALRHLLRRADEPGPQPAVADRVVVPG
jgi:hypothetical protein